MPGLMYDSTTAQLEQALEAGERSPTFYSNSPPTKLAFRYSIAKRGFIHVANPPTAFETSSTSPTASTSRKAQRQVSGEADSASSSLSPVEEQNTPVHADIMDTVTDDGVVDHAATEERQPPKTLPEGGRSRPFGDDPSTFPDPTIYELCKITPGMSEGEIKEICSVAGYPRNDLHDLIPGTPPDKDFSNAKPSNQVQASTFASYLEPYFRPYTEEDLAFLREKGDRVTPFVIPPRGKKHYNEIWSEEDGAMSIDGEKRDRDKLPANQARGSIEDMNDDTAETDQISCAPVLTRMLALMRPEHRTPASENNNGVNGESNTAGEANNDLGGAGGFAMDEPTAPLPPAAYMPESGTDQWKKGPGPNLEPTQVDQRLLAELRHIGFIGADEEPQYDGHFDDEVAARLRYLQAQLKETVIMNTARKARLMELVTPEMAHQEYKTIQDDLDNQVQSAFMKRSRSIGKKKNTKRPGGAGGGSHAVSTASGMARPGIGDVTKTLLERREKWMLSVGPVFQDDPQLGKVPRLSDPNSSIYKPQDMAVHIRRAREAWDEEADEDEE
jgi:transcriptional adapter 3